MREDSETLLTDMNFLNAAIRKALYVTGCTSSRGYFLNRIAVEVKALVSNINTEDKKLMQGLKKKIQNKITYIKRRMCSPDRQYKRNKIRQHNLPTDNIEKDVNEQLKSGNMICLQDYMGDPIAKATVVAYPCIDMYIKDQPEEDVKDWVSVMVELKRRGSMLDFLPCRISKQNWNDVGKNSLLTWPVKMIGSIEEYDLFIAEQSKIRRQARKRQVLPTTTRNGAVRRRLPFPEGVPQLPPPQTVSFPEEVPQLPPPQTVSLPEEVAQLAPPQTVSYPEEVAQLPPAQTVSFPEEVAQLPPPQTVSFPGEFPQLPPPQTVSFPEEVAQLPPPHTVSFPEEVAQLPPPQTVSFPEEVAQLPPPQTVSFPEEVPQLPPPQTVSFPEEVPQLPPPQTVSFPEEVPQLPPPQTDPQREEEVVAEIDPSLAEETDPSQMEAPIYKLHDYVEVAFPVASGKKSVMFFGQIVDLQPIVVNFLRKHDRKNTYVWPRVEDTSEVEVNEITRVLENPTKDARERLVFESAI